MALYLNLNLTPDATEDEIKQSYHKLCLKYHPDKNPNGHHIMIQINESYNILGNPNLRIIYNYGKLTSYLNFKENISDRLINNQNFKLKIANILGDQITSTYNKNNLIDDLNPMNLDKIAAIFLKAHYENDEIFKKASVNLMFSYMLMSSIFWIWPKIKILTTCAFISSALYYVYYRRILF